MGHEKISMPVKVYTVGIQRSHNDLKSTSCPSIIYGKKAHCLHFWCFRDKFLFDTYNQFLTISAVYKIKD